MADVILVVDDDVSFLELVSLILKREGYDVDTATTGGEALEKTRDTFYSLVLVDRKLPDADGVKLLDQIEDTDPKIRKVIFTGYPSIDNVQEAMSLGAHAYLTKPVDPEEILAVVRTQLEKREEEFRDRYKSLE